LVELQNSRDMFLSNTLDSWSDCIEHVFSTYNHLVCSNERYSWCSS